MTPRRIACTLTLLAGLVAETSATRITLDAHRTNLKAEGAEADSSDNCSTLVAGAVASNHPESGSVGCKCLAGKVVTGDDPLCQELSQQPFFPVSLVPTSCKCEPRRIMEASDVRSADGYLSGGFLSNVLGIFGTLGSAILDWSKFFSLWGDLKRKAGHTGYFMQAYLQMMGASYIFPHMNFVRGFDTVGGLSGAWASLKRNTFWGQQSKWLPPVKDETLGVLTFTEYAEAHFSRNFSGTVFDVYYTGGRIPSWEDNENHQKGIQLLDKGMSLASAAGVEPTLTLREMEPRFAFDTKSLTAVTWKGFSWMGPYDIRYASNGVYGPGVVDKLLEKHNTRDTLGVLMTDSVFSAHLRYKEADRSFHLDLHNLERYTPIPGYAAMGGGARFTYRNGRLHTEEVSFGGKRFIPSEDEHEEANQAFSQNRLVGWRYAEKAVIASLLGMTNLVLHVKDLHLELAAAFQAVTVDSFAKDPTHPVRRLLDPFVHRSVQATNDNLKLLFEYKAAEFSLAPLPNDEQMRLIDDAVKENPMILANLDMERYGAMHGMDPLFSTESAQHDPDVWFWRWHYRAKTVQQLFDSMISCWLGANYGEEADALLASDDLAQGWWRAMVKHLPSLKRATEQHPDWAGPGTLTSKTLRHVLRTLFTWLAWVHEDVGHAAAAYVYNPVHTPMCVPEDGEGVPMKSFAFNVAAYRGFVFLERAKLLDSPPSFWFGDEHDKKCFSDFQDSLRSLGDSDKAFSECDDNGFYTCVSRVETAVSS